MASPWLELLRGEHASLVCVRACVAAAVTLEASADLQGSARSFAMRKSALSVIQTALSCGGGQRASGEDTLFLFETASAAAAAAQDARAALAHLIQQQLLQDVRATGFGICFGTMLLCEREQVHWGEPVATAARLSYELCKRAAPGGILLCAAAKAALDCDAKAGRPDALALQRRHPSTRTVPTFLFAAGVLFFLEQRGAEVKHDVVRVYVLGSSKRAHRGFVCAWCV